MANDSPMEDRLICVLDRLTSPVCDLVRNHAQRLVRAWTESDYSEFKDNPKAWAVCAIYIAAVAVRKERLSPPSEPADSDHSPVAVSQLPTVSQLLHAADLNILVFFECMGKVSDRWGLSDAAKQNLMTLKQKYVITYAILRKFDMLYTKLFKSPDEVMSSDPEMSCDQACDKRRICWLLFLLAKGTMLSECGELVLPLQLMMTCMDYTVRKALPFTIRETYSSARYEDLAAKEGGDAILRVVCQEGGCGSDVAEVTSVRRSFFEPFITGISDEHKSQDMEGLPKLEYLESTYRRMHLEAGDINEVHFLSYDRTLITGNERQGSIPPSPDSTVSLPVPPTPVRRAITTVQALKSLLAGTSNQPSQVLIRYFESCSVNPQHSIEHRVDRLKEVFVGHYVEEIGLQASDLACTRFDLGVRLYFRVMEAMLIKEEKRLSTSDFSNLLNSEAFHRSLLTCALEVVMVTYGYTASPLHPGMSAKSSKLLFPWLLDVFELRSFDFMKVIESFIKNEPRLTEDALRHLQGIETQIVEYLAWSVDSPLFETLRVVRGIEITSSVTESTQSPGSTGQCTTAADMFLSPIRHGQKCPPRHNEATPPRHGNPVSSNGQDRQSYPSPQPSHMSRDKRLSVTLNMFFSKVLQLAYHRLQAMCKLLQIKKDLERFTWTCVEYCIANKPWLLRGRHLDQIIMCCMYAVCKVRDSELKFKDIVNMYKCLPHASSTTYKNVYVDAGKDSISIISFYNEIFIPACRDFIHRFQPSNTVPNLSPVPRRCQSVSNQPSSSYQVPGANLYISPMKASPFKSPRPVTGMTSPGQMTPRTRTLYSFGETLGSSERLREFNDQVAKRQETVPRPGSHKRLRLEELAGPDEETTAENTERNDEEKTGTDDTDGRNQLPRMHSILQRRTSQIALDRESLQIHSGNEASTPDHRD